MKRLNPAAANAAASEIFRLMVMRYGANNIRKITQLLRRKALEKPREDDNPAGNIAGTSIKSREIEDETAPDA
jgi:hypothetical protein